MTKHECELMQRLLDENQRLRDKIRSLESVLAPHPLPIPVPGLAIYPYPVAPFRVDDPFSPVWGTVTNPDISAKWPHNSSGGFQ